MPTNQFCYSTAAADDFVQRQLELYDTVHREGPAAVCIHYALPVFKSQYLPLQLNLDL